MIEYWHSYNVSCVLGLLRGDWRLLQLLSHSGSDDSRESEGCFEDQARTVTFRHRRLSIPDCALAGCLPVTVSGMKAAYNGDLYYHLRERVNTGAITDIQRVGGLT